MAIKTMVVACAAGALVLAACNSSRSVPGDDGQVKEGLEAEVQRGLAAATSAVGKFCTCAVDPSSDICKQSPAMCSTDKPTCMSRSFDNPYHNPYYQTEAQKAQCVLAAFKLRPSESLTFLTCVRAAWDLYAACMDKAACAYSPVVSCESNDRQGAEKKCGLLPQEVRTAINLCLNITDAGL